MMLCGHPQSQPYGKWFVDFTTIFYGEKVDEYFNIRTFTAVILKGIQNHLYYRIHLKPESRRAKTCFETPNLSCIIDTRVCLLISKASPGLLN